MSLHTTDIGRPYAGICVSHSLTDSDTLDSDIDRGRQRSLTMEAEVGRGSGAIAAWILRTLNTAPTATVGSTVVEKLAI